MESMQEITGLITNTGVTVVVIGYFIFRDYKFMSQLQTTLTSLITSLINTVDTLKGIVKTKCQDE